MSQFKRIGAFIGTVPTTAIVADIVRPKRSADIISAVGQSYSRSINAMLGETEGGRLARLSEERHRTNMEELQAARRTEAQGVPREHLTLTEWLRCYLAVPIPFVLETWEQAACRIWDVEPVTWEDVETLADLVHVLKSDCGTDGV